MSGGLHLSKEFFELLKAIGESKSKQEEDRIVAREVQTLKRKLETPSSSSGKGGGGGGGPGGGGGIGGKTNAYGAPLSHSSGPPPVNALTTSKKKAKEFLIRLLYVEMLGHDGSFGYIKAVELAASSSIMHKRTGYLVCASCLSPEHEFRFMLVNQMQRDLSSSHVLEAAGALVAVSTLITSDMVPAVQGEVMKLIEHSSETVRKKAVIALHRCHQLAPESVTRQDMIDKLRKSLCDRDPAVMGSTLNVIEALARVDAVPFKELVPSLVSILKQICEHRLPSDFDYHRVPAPWMQMKIVRILSILGKSDANASEGCYEILAECMKRSDVGINAGYAVTYECVKCISSIYPNAQLLDAAAGAISRFLSSRSQNLRYLGVTGLAGLVELNPSYAVDHQLAVIECLEDPDETLQRKTLDLLYRMTNPVNVEFITEKLLLFLKDATDVYLKKDLASKICTIGERYAPSNAWYVRTITDLFGTAGDLVGQDVAQNVMSLIAEGSGGETDEDEAADMLLRQQAVDVYASYLDKPLAKLPRVLAETMAWVLGEYAYLSVDLELTAVLSKLCKIASRGKKEGTMSVQTRRVVLTAIMKLVAQAGTCPPDAARIIDDYASSRDVDLQRRCLEFQGLLTTAPQLLGEILPVDASCEDVDVDPDLSFLDGYVSEALTAGAALYEKPDEDDDDDDGGYLSGAAQPSAAAAAFKMTPYEKPQTAQGYLGSMRGVGSGGSGGDAGVTPPPGGGHGAMMGGMGGGSAPEQYGAVPSGGDSGHGGGGEPHLVLRGAANVWGKGGLSAPPAHAAGAPPSSSGGFGAPPPASAPSTSPSSYGGAFGAHQAPAPEPVKTAAQIRKEQMAASLFGGLAGGTAAPPPPPPPPHPSSSAPASASVTPAAPEPKAPAPAPPPAPPPAPAPAPAAEIDLLGFDVEPAPTAASPAAPPPDDIFGASVPLDVSAPPAPPAPETEPPAPAAPAAAPPEDPFAAEGLLGSVSDTALAPLQSDAKFEYNGTQMAPLPITTTQFGPKWGSCPSTNTVSINSAKVATLDKFMDLLGSVGLHPVEKIAATNEGIAAGMVGGTILALVHGKVSPQSAGGSKLDVLVKSTDGTMGGCLAMYLQNMMR